MGLEDFKTDGGNSVTKDNIVFDRTQHVQATLDGSVTDAQLSLDYYGV